VQAFARTRGLPFYFVECRAEREESVRRLRHRAEGESVSDGRLEIFDDFVAQWEPVEELPPQEHLVIDTSRPLEETEALLRSAIPTWPPGLNG
jgi:predicted kinase